MTGLTGLLGTVKRKIKQIVCHPLEMLPDVPDLFHSYRFYATHPEIRRLPGGWQYRGRFYPDYLTVGGACFAIFKTAQRYCAGSGVDVGAGYWPLPGAVPIDSTRGPGEANDPEAIADASLDFVFSSHCLEHVERWEEFISFWLGKVKPGGIFFLYLPHPECEMWHQGSPFVGDGHKWRPDPETVKAALRRNDLEVIDCDDGPDVMMSFFVCGRK